MSYATNVSNWRVAVWQGASHLQLRCGVWSVGRAEPEHVDDTAGSPGAHAAVLMRQEVLRCQLLRDGQQGIPVCLLLVHAPQLLRQGLQAAEQLRDGNGLAGAPCQRFIEGQAGCVFGLLVFVLVDMDCGAGATARTGHDGGVSRRRWMRRSAWLSRVRRRRKAEGWAGLQARGLGRCASGWAIGEGSGGSWLRDVVRVWDGL